MMAPRNNESDLKVYPEFYGHPAFQKLEQFNARIKEPIVLEKVNQKVLLFFKSFYDYTQRKLSSSVPGLISPTDMNALVPEIDGALNNINIYLGDGNPGHLVNAQNNIFSFLNRMNNFPSRELTENTNVEDLIAFYESVIVSKIDELNQKKEALEIKLDETANKIASKQEEFNRISDLVKEKETLIQNLNAGFQNEFINFRTQSANQAENDRTTYRNEQEKFRAKIIEDTSTFIKELENKREEAKKIVGVIGNIGATGNYQNIANDHCKAADRWRLVAILFMCILSTLLVYSIWKVSDPSYDWHKAIIRIVAAAVLIYPATYAARESGKHRRLENLNRKAELELASINPFIAILTNEKQQAIKEKLVEKYFGNNASLEEAKGDGNQNEFSIGTFEKLTDQIIKVIKQVNSK